MLDFGTLRTQGKTILHHLTVFLKREEKKRRVIFVLFRIHCGVILCFSLRDSFKNRIIPFQLCTNVFTFECTWDEYKQTAVCTSSYKSTDDLSFTQLHMMLSENCCQFTLWTFFFERLLYICISFNFQTQGTLKVYELEYICLWFDLFWCKCVNSTFLIFLHHKLIFIEIRRIICVWQKIIKTEAIFWSCKRACHYWWKIVHLYH